MLMPPQMESAAKVKDREIERLSRAMQAARGEANGAEAAAGRDSSKLAEEVKRLEAALQQAKKIGMALQLKAGKGGEAAGCSAAAGQGAQVAHFNNILAKEVNQQEAALQQAKENSQGPVSSKYALASSEPGLGNLDLDREVKGMEAALKQAKAICGRKQSEREQKQSGIKWQGNHSAAG
eukprot:1152079-Pelagomonas_calceolata.AAC.10